MGTKDILLETVAVSRRWSSLPKRTMTDQLTPVDKRVRLPLAVTLILGTAMAACARISSESPSTASPIVDNGPRVADVTPTNEVLGIQFNEVAVWDKATLATKDASISAQINALSREIEKQRPELFVNGTQLDAFAISVPTKDMTGKKTNTIYPFIVGSNKADQSKSFVTIVLRRADGQGIFAQSLTPMDVVIDGQLRGALVFNDEPVFVFPKSLKEWNAQSDAQKTSSDVIFIPPTGEKIKIPLGGGKLASPAIYDAQFGYTTPDVKPTATATATNTPEPTSTPTTAPSKTPTAVQPLPTEKPKPTTIPATPKPTMGIEWRVTDGGNSEAIVSQSNLLTQTEISPFLDQIRARGRTTRKYNPNKPECGVGSTCYIVQKINDKLDAIWVVTIIP